MDKDEHNHEDKDCQIGRVLYTTLHHGVFIKGNASTHLQEHCKVTQTTKHKFSCLSETCLKHSLVCQDHVEENESLLAAHYEELATLKEELKKNPKNRGTSQNRAPHTLPLLQHTWEIQGS